MVTVVVPYHLDERLPGLATGLTVDREVVVELPTGDPWQRMAVLYEQVARVIADGPGPALVVSGDCTTSLGVLAGLQRAGHDPGVVWFDAHADFHTEETTESGYLGGMPLALAVGLGSSTARDALGARPVAESRVLLVDARDTDPAEQVLLDRTAVRRTSVDEVGAVALPEGPLYLHIDVDVCGIDDVPAPLLYPTEGGPRLPDVVDAVGAVARTGRVVGVGLAATWRPDVLAGGAAQDVLRRLAAAAST